MAPSAPHALGGLTRQEAERRLQADGPNTLPADGPSSFWRTAFRVLTEPMILLLLAAAGIYVALGDPLEAFALLGFVGVIIVIELVQQRRTERALDALRELTTPRALVIRDGTERHIPSHDVVRGDLLVVAEGDRIAADARVIEASSLSADESLLTGESVPVRKRPAREDEAEARPGGDDLPFLYSGTLIVKGRGLAEVTATGLHTEAGRIGRALREVRAPRSRLQREVDGIVRIVAAAAIALSLSLAVIYGLRLGNPTDGLLAGIALAMSLLPEELPILLTIFLALGANRMARRGVLTRNMDALADLGAVSVLCTDKTGTLTENHMRVAAIYAGEAFDDPATGPLPAPMQAVIEHAVLASERQPFDPMEVAFHEEGERHLAGTGRLHPDWKLVREYPLAPELLSITHVWQAEGEHAMDASAKGAPEAIIDLCHLGAGEAARVERAASALAVQGLRVLGVAAARIPDGAIPPLQHDIPFAFIGLAGLEDPVRNTVPRAVAECRSAGIRVMMITGDYPLTASAIARKAGIEHPEAVLTGAEIASMDERELAERLRNINVIARAVPEQKLAIVRALATDGEVVAMTGDGVNDAPALEAAHIGVAMGRRGTAVAREAADLVVTDDDFASIVAGIRHGRRIFDNLRKAVIYVIAIHITIAAAALVPALLGWPLILLPLEIVFLQLVIDPACSLAFESEAEEPGIMRRPPRQRAQRLADRRTIRIGIAQGLSVLVALFTVLVLARSYSASADHTRALAFSTIMGGNIALVLTNLAWDRSSALQRIRRNRIAYAIAAFGTAALALTLTVPPLQRLLRFGDVDPWLAAIAFAAGFLALVWWEAAKRAWPNLFAR